MKLMVSYRPMTGILNIWNRIDDELSENDRQQIHTFHEYEKTEDDDWFYSLSFYNGDFHHFVALGVNDKCEEWNLWLAQYLPDSVVAEIHALVQKWDSEYDGDADLRTRVLARNNAELEV